jgi:RNA polymerase sigma-70 factor (sigma-E family)
MQLGMDFDAFVRVASPGLLRTAYLLCGDQGHAEDLLQTTLLRTARRWSSAREQPTAYARRVLVNLAKDRWRDRSRRPTEVVDFGQETAVADAPGQIDLRHTLLPLVLTLPARQRAVLALRFFDDLSVEETAQALDCSQGTVKSQTHVALTRLRVLLADNPTFDDAFMEIDHADR